MPYYLVEGKDPLGNWEREKTYLRPYRDLRQAQVRLKLLNNIRKSMPPVWPPHVILHVDRYGNRTVVE
jgi:hypothetical protein